MTTTRPARPTPEEIDALPPFDALPLDRIALLETPAQLAEALAAIRAAGVVGFDTESKPTFARGEASTGPHVLQLALDDRAFVVRTGDAPPIDFIRAVLESDDIAKVGFGLDGDRAALARRFGVTLRGVVELTEVLRALGHRQMLGAKAAVAVVLGRRLQKSKRIGTSDWSSPRLSPSQLAYAANDAYAALMIHRAMGSPRTPTSATPAVEVRHLGARDLRAMRALNAMFGRAFDDPGHYTAAPPDDAYLTSLLRDRTFIALAAMQDREVIGGIAAYELRKFEQMRSEIYLYDLAVDETHRRRGVATALIDALKRIARERGTWVIFVQADHGDDPAIALYTTLGTREDVMHFDIEP